MAYQPTPPPSDPGVGAPPLVPPPVAKAEHIPIELPPRPPPTAPHDSLDDDDYLPSAPPIPSAPPPAPLVSQPSAQQLPAQPPVTHVPISVNTSTTSTKVDEVDPEKQSKPEVDYTQMSMDELPAYIGFLLLGVLLGTILNFFSFIFNCCTPGLRGRPVRRNFFNAGCAIGVMIHIGMLATIAVRVKQLVTKAIDQAQKNNSNAA